MSELQAINLSKTFPGVVALDGVSVQVKRGTVHALVGANGAGKSTLIKILTGYYAEYAGQIEIDGERALITKPADAIARGIEVVHQEVDMTLIPYLTVSENLFIEELAERGRAPVIHWRKLHARARTAAARVGLNVDVRKQVEDLSLHEKQMLVIARAVSRNVKYLILDEPTASLGLREVDTLFQVIRELKKQGVGIIYISHRLGEVREIADEITVLRNGKQVAHFAGGVEMGQIVEAMLGVLAMDAFPPRRQRTPGEIVMQAKGLTRAGRVRDVSLAVRRGEILGVAGLVGAGKTELLRLLFGADKLDAGEITMNGKRLTLRRPEDAVKHGIYLIPEERRKQGLLVEEPVRPNVTLPFLRAYTFLSWILRRRETAHVQQVIMRVGLIPPNPEMLVKNLSGGNQQKVVIGKWVGGAPQVMMFDEATQGIDVKAKRDVYELAQQISETTGVVYASSDLDEVLALADRVIVMRDGRIVAELAAAQAGRQQVLELATGAPPAGVPQSNPMDLTKRKESQA